MDLIEQIKREYDSFTKNEKLIADYILKKPIEFARSSVDNLIINIGVSKAALIRFSKKLGYSGYIEYKYELNRFLISNNSKQNDGDSNNPITSISNKYSNVINKISDTLDYKELKKAAKEIVNANKVRVFGFNKTALSAKQLSYRGFNVGLEIYPITDDSIIIHHVIDHIESDDVTIIFTIKDNTNHFSKIIPYIKEKKSKIILVTLNENLPFIKDVNHTLLLPNSLNKYGLFIDNQVLFFIFIEILISEIASLTKH